MGWEFPERSRALNIPRFRKSHGLDPLYYSQGSRDLSIDPCPPVFKWQTMASGESLFG
ncbi:hypothetical protein BDQ94DRAFT_141824 [Aspergillus welwitschiae]|uniref:Uncharacterized protein n=1 Tax=Aspergillus welwitschiae TaxID=1341132 RepID=A0A3F3Q5Y7_9EURO|nr:hypothetical protein BDQ94DRAFT_141824 [Aspergillus welwitschiae]RDH34600.1 hypothetical protein BDQ94DRAFT_141824 [Aspergillus welwitschiae]